MRTQEEKDMQFDTYLQNHIQSFMAQSDGIEPSDDFASKVMDNCISCEKTHTRNINIGLILLGLTPIIARQAWMFIRNDYFSVGEMPLQSLIYGLYHFFMSSWAFYLFLTLGITIAALVYLKRWRHVSLKLRKLA